MERTTEEDVVMRTWKMEVIGHRKRGSDEIEAQGWKTWGMDNEPKFIRKSQKKRILSL